MANNLVFLDANVIIYALDSTSDYHAESVKHIQILIEKQVVLCTSHHVIEEVLHIVQKLSPDNTTSTQVVDEIRKIPGLTLIEPAAKIEFAHDYAILSDELNLGVNDALLLQLMIDAEITTLFSYDKKFIKKAREVEVKSIPELY